MSLFHKTLQDVEAAVASGDFRRFKQVVDNHINVLDNPMNSNLKKFEDSIKEYFMALTFLQGMTRLDGPSKDVALDHIRKARQAAEKMKSSTEALLNREFQL